ncbi:GNAT family N-acetyltransferase [Pseudoroseomonas globiformis]|uniref:GNAT family N-acetyltransferase n=1 Tax=Teichococcus globiformis TaxID=2307229 RepID=A0ABV7G2Q8_9PROT
MFRPQSVLLVADPRLPEADVLARNIGNGQYKGQLYIIGMMAAGFHAVQAIPELPAAPDLAVLCLPAAEQEGAMRQLAARGCYTAIIPVSSPDLAGLCARTGVAALGAHSFGICLPSIGLNASLSHIAPRPGRLALLTQSPSMARVIIDWAEGEGLGFSHIVGIGSNLGVGFAASLDWLARDSAAGAILLDLRRIKNRRMFISAARAAARTRPVLALRPGGRQSDASGIADAVMEAALRRAGVLRLPGLEDLLSAAETLARLRPSRHSRGIAAADDIVIVSNGQAPALLAADAAVASGLRLQTLESAAKDALSLLLSLPVEALTNPLILPHGHEHRLGEAASSLAALSSVGAVVAVHAPGLARTGAAASMALSAAAKTTRGAPILVGWLGEATAAPLRAQLADAGLAVFATPEAAVRGAVHLAADRRNRAAAAELPPRDATELVPDRARAAAIIDQVRQEGRLRLNEAESLDLLEAYGQKVVPGSPVAEVEGAVSTAMRLGFPVVLKLLSPDLPRKTEVGGVVLGIRDVASLRRAAHHMMSEARRLRPHARIDGFLVQRQLGQGASKDHELRLRLGDDPMFGPWIGFGRGGTASDFEADVAYDLPPLNRTLALAMIRRTRSSRLLSGFRDYPQVDLMKVADSAVRLSQIAVDFPEVDDLILNPLLVNASEAVVLDASAQLRPLGLQSQLAISPYPSELEHPWHSRDGRKLLIRPIRPEDAEAHAEAFASLTPEDVRWRFFNQIRELSREQIARMTQIDYDREMAIIAVHHREERQSTAGVARIIREAGSAEGEFAVVVTAPWKGQGLGRHLMTSLLAWAGSQGLTTVKGQILADNRPMISFIQSLGFTLHRVPDDDDVLEARISLG